VLQAHHGDSGEIRMSLSRGGINKTVNLGLTLPFFPNTR
jgi:hypothetical protein